MRKGISAGFLLVLGILIGWSSNALHLGWEAEAQPPATKTKAGFRVRETLPEQPVVIDNSDLTPEEQVNVDVYEKRNLGVVYISTKALRPDSFLTVTAIEGSGSGSVIDGQGHILTNFHVIEGARDVNVTLYNGESYAAEVVGKDPDNDIAVLRIQAPASSLFPIPMGDSSRLRVGQRILAIGNPFGLERTMSDGIISSLNRQLPSRNKRTMKSIIQIDAALNQGNSGGPLLNTRGELIGMNTAIATSTGDNAGIGFSIPANTIQRVVPQLIQYGRVSRPTIGITRVYETPEGQGIIVVDVTQGGPADNAGIQGYRAMRRSADMIIGVDGVRVSNADDLLNIIESKKAGDQVSLSLLRKGKKMNVNVVLGSSD